MSEVYVHQDDQETTKKAPYLPVCYQRGMGVNDQEFPLEGLRDGCKFMYIKINKKQQRKLSTYLSACPFDIDTCSLATGYNQKMG